MNPYVIAMPGNEGLAAGLPMKRLRFETRQFPDGETYMRLLDDVRDRAVNVLCSLHLPDSKIMPLYFLCNLLKESGAKRVILIAPYLAYMRQDKAFQKGEAVTSRFFASLISGFVDALITIDPHLHRYGGLSEIYSIPTTVIHAAPAIAEWIAANVARPLIIGPDSESKQWVGEVATLCNAPYVVLQKTRRGDRAVGIQKSSFAGYEHHTSVLIDDIISTAKTMIEAAKQLKNPICIGVHPAFCDGAYRELQKSGVSKIVTCNTIPHLSNGIDLSPLLARHVH